MCIRDSLHAVRPVVLPGPPLHHRLPVGLLHDGGLLLLLQVLRGAVAQAPGPGGPAGWFFCLNQGNRQTGRRIRIFGSVSSGQKGSYPYVYLDGISLKRSWSGEVRNVSILVAIGVNAEGYREILGIAEGAKEDRSSWHNLYRAVSQIQAN
mgnify:CR=1 FL=1